MSKNFFQNFPIFLILSLLLSFSSFGNAEQLEQREDSYSSSQNLNQNKVEVLVDLWKFPEFSPIEKQDLIFSVKTVFNDFYVHKNQKIEDYNFDAKKEANKLSSDMSSETLLRHVNMIFNNVHDLHTGFRYPFPAQCILGGFPIEVDLAYTDADSGLKEKLIVKNKLSQTIESEYATEADQIAFSKIEPGDEILAISNLGLEGVTPNLVNSQSALKLLESVSRGANADAAKTRAVQLFFSRNGAYMKPPSGRFMLYVKHAANNQITFHEFPWIVYLSSNPACQVLLDEESAKDKKIRSTDSLLQKNHIVLNHKAMQSNGHAVLKKSKSGLDEERFNDFYTKTDQNENIVKTIIESNDNKKFALVHIKRFVPSEVANMDAHYLKIRAKIIKEVNELREFILQNRDEIEGLIFDVRGNGGGYCVFPQLIANAFISEFIPNFVLQPIVSKMNRDTFYNLEFSRYFKRLGTSDPLVDKYDRVLSAPVSETADEMDAYLNLPEFNNTEMFLYPAERFDEDENDAFPPEYTAEYKKLDTLQNKQDKYTLKEIFINKPVAVLTNSNCYSACDVFVSIMKDYQIAKIIGETAHTGGGGANVVEWNNFVKPVILNEYGTKGSLIPNGKPMPQGSEIRFAWNRIVRLNALNQTSERYIEGNGVLIEKENVYKPSVTDVLTNGQLILEKIMNDMIVNRETYRINR